MLEQRPDIGDSFQITPMPQAPMRRIGRVLAFQLQEPQSTMAASISQLRQETSIADDQKWSKHLSALEQAFFDLTDMVDSMATSGNIAVSAAVNGSARELVLLPDDTKHSEEDKNPITPQQIELFVSATIHTTNTRVTTAKGRGQLLDRSGSPTVHEAAMGIYNATDKITTTIYALTKEVLQESNSLSAQQPDPQNHY